MKIKEITQIEYLPNKNLKYYNEYSVSVWTDSGHFFEVTGWYASQIIKASQSDEGYWSWRTKANMLYSLRSYIMMTSGEKRVNELFTDKYLYDGDREITDDQIEALTETLRSIPNIQFFSLQDTPHRNTEA